MKNKRMVITIVLCIALIITFVMLSSYALWRVKDTQTDSNIVIGACLHIELEEPNQKGFILEDAWPISDEAGLSTKGYNFNVINTCKEDVAYQIILDSIAVPHPGREMNPEYIKVKLNNGTISKYKLLEDGDSDAGYETLANKKIYTGIVPKASEEGNGIVEHNIKLWISEDAPNSEIGKEFNSKVRVIAGQNIEPDNQLSLKVLSKNGEPKATIDNIEIGDRVGFGTEEFYVIGINGNNVELLSRYLLNVGDNPNPEYPIGLQAKKIGYTRKNVDDSYSATEYGEEYQDEFCEWDEHLGKELCTQYVDDYYGKVPFSNEEYWWDYNNFDYLRPYTQNSFVYNDQSNLKQYVEQYAIKLRNMGLYINNGTLLSLDEVSVLCNLNITNPGQYSECPNYLFETTFWLGNVYDNNNLWTVVADGVIDYWNYENSDYSGMGLRPVINISL